MNMKAITAQPIGELSPPVRDRIRAMLPDHAHEIANDEPFLAVFRRTTVTSWQWTTPTGRWSIELPVAGLPPVRRRIYFAGTGIFAKAELPPTELGLIALRALLEALGAIEPRKDP